MNKTVRLGITKTHGGMAYSVYCKINIEDGKLSITGVEGPTLSGNCYGSCGQIGAQLQAVNISAAPGWNQAKIQRFLKIWQRWHLNDMRAGSPRQEAYLRERINEYIKEKEATYVSHYDWATRVLNDAGLNPDREYMGYKYGIAWLTEPLPPDVVAWLEALPVADKTPAWV